MKANSTLLNLRLALSACLVAAVTALLVAAPNAMAKEAASAESATGDAATAEEQASYYPVTFTDMDGDEVTIESEPQKIACLMGGTYDYVNFFGASDKVVVSMQLSHTAWRDKLIDADTEGLVELAVSDCRDPNVEELAALGVDTVFLWGDRDEYKEQMEALGMTVIQCSSTSGTPTTVDEYVENVVAIYRMFGTALNNVEKAEQFETYVRDMAELVTGRTSTLTDDEHPSVYLVRSQADGLEYFPWPGTYPFMAELAGGTYVEHGDGNGVSADATMEQIVEWDPEYVFVCWCDTKDEIVNNEQWATVSAVKNGNVYLVPAAESSWISSPLWLLYMAQSMHPDLFEDIDYVAEIQNYYSTFYGYDLTLEEAQNIYQRLLPDGSPRA